MDFKKHLPSKDQLRATKSLRFLGDVIFEPNLWHFNRHSVSFAMLVGGFCCFLPIPFQMIPCVFLVMWLKGNLPLSIGLVWISNPITMPAMMYFTYRVGISLLGQTDTLTAIPDSIDQLFEQIAQVWQPLILGSLITGLTTGLIGFVLVRVYWRWKVARNWSMRRLRNKLKHED